MDQVIKAKWVEALRSGRYEQGHEALKRGGRYCCLGVLREVMDPSDETGASPHLGPNSDGIYSTLTGAQLEKAGLTDAQQETLWRKNDGYFPESLMSFFELADYIEANL